MLSNSISKVNSTLNDISRVTQTFVYQSSSPDNSIIDLLRKHKTYNDNLNSYDLLQSKRELKYIFESILYTHNYINGVYLFTAGKNSFYSAKVNNELKSDYNPTSSLWYKLTTERSGKLYISDVGLKDFSMSSKPSISFSRLIIDPNTHKSLGVILIDCSLDIFNDINKEIIPDQSNIFLTDYLGKIVYENSKTLINTQMSQEVCDKIAKSNAGSFINRDTETLTVFDTFPNYNLKLVAQISINQLKKKFEPTRNILIFIAFTCSLVFLMISFILSKIFTKPIIELSRVMKANKFNELAISKKYLHRDDEISTLYHEYNEMINKINTFIKERYQNRLILLDSQMRALEAQINSHFLYNTLESINSIAEIEEVESISIISKALGDMFRYSIKTESELVKLDEELTHVSNYLAIQKIRYGEKCNFSLNIPEQLKNEKILKLILQPLIENAIYHGLETKREPGNIIITGFIENKNIILEVTDDGVGMSDEQIKEIEKLLQEPPQFTDMGRRDKRSIGIKNIHSRIELYYGNGYGLTLSSKKNVGTTVQISIPQI